MWMPALCTHIKCSCLYVIMFLFICHYVLVYMSLCSCLYVIMFLFICHYVLVYMSLYTQELYDHVDASAADMLRDWEQSSRELTDSDEIIELLEVCVYVHVILK
jgi:hypothetical protein